ncbi:hypothetical protein [Opitutus terrae]|uniref:Uncharacterized protein n=1 Tax=Opitutus terrae (strain DSM 11246 / JCM 15787 / PB90-1) TaxID=452637 RepID=B1ZQH9_OPITP|nr:hypothetical protein [Opitutus terrae]ACB75588.1 hypothetical protein Oter_2306 [Opitutus terrae PB90-1]
MKDPESKPEPAWAARVARARNDVAPPVDVEALLRAVRTATVAPRPGWLVELASLFAGSRAVPACLAATLLLGGVASWEAWSLWQALPWAEMIVETTGGVP